MRRHLILLAAGLACLVAVIPAGAQPADGETLTISDPAGDWNGGQGAQLGDALGQDLVSASIGMSTAETVVFTIGVTSLPSIGGVPEVTRYQWQLLVDDRTLVLDGKWSNYSRGVCDPTAGSCPPPRDPGPQPFFVRGNCTTTQNVTTCQELATIKATFDTAKKTITVPVPATLLGLKPCSTIGDGPTLAGWAGPLTATPTAFATYGSFPMDGAALDGQVFRVPSPDPVNSPCPPLEF